MSVGVSQTILRAGGRRFAFGAAASLVAVLTAGQAFAQCGDPGAGSCCVANGTPFCDDMECCNLVCACDPFCCDTEWDALCAGDGFEPDCGAAILCADICKGAPCVPGAGDCFSANGTPGCDDPDCCQTVCAADPFCCDTAWDQICADGAANLCDVTPDIVPQAVMGDPLNELTPEQLDRFNIGKDIFSLTVVEEDGLGPIFNQNSCASCHNNPVGGPGSITVTRFGADDKGEFDPLEQFGGSLLQAEAISDDCAEEISKFANVTQTRRTIGMMGYGLVEAIPDQQIIDIETAQNASGPPITGHVHMVELLEEPGTFRVGRFGHKAQVATIHSFSGDALLNEMGITNDLVGQENDPNGINPPDLIDCDMVADPEDNTILGQGMTIVERVTDFQRFLTQPPQTPKTGMTGEAVFVALGCAECHTQTFTTADDPGLEDAIRNKEIHPYSDFLLHFMGLTGDPIVQGAALQQEVRTPPLWGIRTRDPMWHNATIAGGTFEDRILQAIANHDVVGSEAQQTAQAFNAAPQQDKDALIAFLDSLGRAEFDQDGDGDRDAADFRIIKDCFGLVGITPDDPCAISDVNCDGTVDETDILVFASIFGEADCNGNGTEDLIDILTGFSDDENNNAVPDECDPACVGDLSGDGVVNAADLAALLGVWGPCPGCPEDLNGDGVVNAADLALLLGGWGPCP